MEEAGGFPPGGAAEKFGNGKQASFAEKGFELTNDGEEGNEVDGGHAALDEEAGDDEVAEVVVKRGHRTFRAVG